jgi:mRNA interferase MazF
VSFSGPFLRGCVYGANLGDIGTEEYFLIVSNNIRNRQLRTALAVRLTTTIKPNLASIVPLGAGEALVGSVLCDNILELYEDEVTRELGALSRGAMDNVGRGLAAALDLK